MRMKAIKEKREEMEVITDELSVRVALNSMVSPATKNYFVAGKWVQIYR